MNYDQLIHFLNRLILWNLIALKIVIGLGGVLLIACAIDAALKGFFDVSAFCLGLATATWLIGKWITRLVLQQLINS